MLLYDGYKGHIRTWGLIINKPIKNYIYVESVIDIFVNKYDRSNISNKIHNDVYGSTKSHRLSDLENYQTILYKIKEICKKCIIFFKDIDKLPNEKNFIILGYDFILDKDYKPYLIEVNQYPDMAETKGITIKQYLFNDFYNLFIDNNDKEHSFIDVDKEITNEEINTKLKRIKHDHKHDDTHIFKNNYLCSNISKHKSKVYILGGFGTFSGIDISYKTVKNYSEITDIVNDSDNIPFILDSESNKSTLNETKKSTYNNFINGMIRAEKYCISNNINNLIMGIACDTMHLCLEDYKIHNNITFVNMIDCVCNKVNQIYRNYEKIYLLSAYETFTSNIYHNKLECNIEKDIKLFPLVKELYTKIKKGIVLNKVICNNIITLIPNNSLVILGCTELPVNLDIFNKCCSKKKIDFIDCNNELAKQLSLKFKEFSSK